MAAPDAVDEQQIIHASSSHRSPSEALLTTTGKINEKLAELNAAGSGWKISDLSHTVSLTVHGSTLVSVIAVVDKTVEAV